MKALEGRETVLWTPLLSKKYGVSSPEGDADAVRILQTLADAAAPHGLRIAIYPHTGFWVARVEDAVRVARKVQRPNVGVTFNLCHWLMVDGEDLRQRIEAAAPHLFMVTINGADRGDTWKALIQTLDQGSFEVGQVLDILEDMGYQGPIGLQGYGIGGDVRENLNRSMGAWRELCGLEP
jgi:sugar phosphate isomerase/epimerase